MDEITKMGEMENKEVRDPRPLCVHCVNEKREVPKIGILWSDLDGKGRRPVCGEHYDIAVENRKKALRAFIEGNPEAIKPA